MTNDEKRATGESHHTTPSNENPVDMGGFIKIHFFFAGVLAVVLIVLAVLERMLS